MIVTARLLNVLALGFTVIFSGFLLLSVKWRALQSECVIAGTCDIAEVRFQPLRPSTFGCIKSQPVAYNKASWQCKYVI